MTNHRLGYFWMEDDVYYEEVTMVGEASALTEEEEPRLLLPWSKKPQAKTKATFGFSRVLDEV